MSNKSPGIASSGTNIHNHADAIFGPKVLQSLLNSEDKSLTLGQADGTLLAKKEEVIEHFKSLGAKLVYNSYGTSYALYWKDSLITISFYKKTNTANMYWQCTDPEVLEAVEAAEKKFLSKVKTNLVFSIIKNSTGLAIRTLGDGHAPLIEDNYNPEVIEDLKFVVDAYKKNPPNGRIVILDGIPGTGKTHLIRSLFSQLDQIFLVVPSNLISVLDGPELLPMLVNARDTYDKPIILVIEDGDACLVPRKSDNISTIASMLNLSDGILGSIINIKIVISTNAQMEDMDEAILRPGRLCKRITVGPLLYDAANKVYQRLMNDTSVSLEKAKEYTLAEIYNIFNNKDNPAAISKPIREPIGFNPNRNNEVSSSKKDLTLNIKI